MKRYQTQFIRSGVVAFLLFFIFSCNPKGESHEDDNIDSVEIQPAVTEEVRTSWNDSLHSANGVRVELDAPDSFDWVAFRQKFHQSEDSGEDFPDEVAVGPWVTWNEYEFRRVYRHDNDALWIQTFYRSKDSTDRAEGQGTLVLDSQDPGYMQMGPLWADMLTRGRHLNDSL